MTHSIAVHGGIRNTFKISLDRLGSEDVQLSYRNVTEGDIIMKCFELLEELKRCFPDIVIDIVTEHFIYYTLPFGKFQTKVNLSTMELDGLVMIESVESKLIEDILKCTK